MALMSIIVPAPVVLLVHVLALVLVLVFITMLVFNNVFFVACNAVVGIVTVDEILLTWCWVSKLVSKLRLLELLLFVAQHRL